MSPHGEERVFARLEPCGPCLVMAGLVPAIHVFLVRRSKDADARHKAGHDERDQARQLSLK